ncbi:MAG: alpha/beta hydrolase [Erysipelotrichaceae bacterium]|nr:alpha/beta hydrolase [Erysipelotrichaceae bacterium]
MYKKTYIEPTVKTAKGLDIVTDNYYSFRVKKKPEITGPVIKGVDVGLTRFADLNLDYQTTDLCTTEVEYEDYDIGGYRVRWFHPLSVVENAPVIFYIHGGGYITGTIERYVNVDKRLAELINGIVVHVDYTLSPETGYPTAIEQSYHAIEYMLYYHDRFLIDPEKVAIMGDSAGGNCCAALPFRDRKNNYIKLNILYYPAVDMTDYSPKKFDMSYFGKGLDPMVEARVRSLVDTSDMNRAYLQNGEDPHDEMISPLLAKNFEGYPRTLVICAEYDFLTMQSEEFCDRLNAAGIQVDFYKFIGTFHGFLDRVGYMESSDRSMKIVAQIMREHFNY